MSPTAATASRMTQFGGTSLFIGSSLLCAFSGLTAADAKTPGATYCISGVCHRVKTIAEVGALVGSEETVLASHYDDCKVDAGNPCSATSSGEEFHPDRADNAASPIYPNGTVLLVMNPKTAQETLVRINDSGPYNGARELDVSRATAERLGFADAGVTNVRIRIVSAPDQAQ
jgi:peptidoglycan lytic transglycosylase